MKNPLAGSFDIAVNERVQVKVVYETKMWHPCIHTGTRSSSPGPVQEDDTVIDCPKESVTFEFQADNPGQWLTRCRRPAGRTMRLADLRRWTGRARL
ncbi:multicopper oxidase domain-containing protein [Cryobacterium sp. TMT4-10]|uniref:multicopper oxidase domain-containing protein n=1 Tax=unclassified Cryobacterium TaxID=2649013 RepID=UPI003514D207